MKPNELHLLANKVNLDARILPHKSQFAIPITFFLSSFEQLVKNFCFIIAQALKAKLREIWKVLKEVLCYEDLYMYRKHIEYIIVGK